MNYTRLMTGLLCVVGHSFALAHPGPHGHTHSLVDMPAITLCMLALAGVTAAISKQPRKTTKA